MRSSLGLELEREKVGFIENTAMRHREKGGFYEKTAMRHRRVGGRAVTVTAMLHRQKDIEGQKDIDGVGEGK